MALELEDGTGKANAQSYVDVAAARTYAAARGVTLSTDDSAVEVYLINAMDYLEAQRARYQGAKLLATQALQFPRTDVYLDNNIDPEDPAVIPAVLKAAQCQLVIEQANGADLMPTSDGLVVKSKKVDVLETVYAVGDNAGAAAPSFPKVDALLAPLLIAAGAFGLDTVRM